MFFLKASPLNISIDFRNSAKWFGIFLFAAIFFSMSIAEGITSFQEFKNNSDPSVHFKLEAMIGPQKINPENGFPLHLKMELSDGWHIYSHRIM